MITVALSALVLGAVLGWTARHFRVLSWAAARVASALGARWFITKRLCSGCGRRVHLMREAGPGTYRCVLHCRSLSAAQAASDRTETAQDAGLGILGWPGAPGDAQAHGSQDRTEERNEPMQTPATAIIGDRIEHELMPGFPMLVEQYEPCETDCARPEPHRQYLITDPEGNTDWLCAYDVRKLS